MLLVVFPHQLFADHPGLRLGPDRIILIEDPLFFGDSIYPMRFHKQKLWLHRASMKRYETELKTQGFRVDYLDYDASKNSLVEQLRKFVDGKAKEDRKLCCVDPTDFILSKRLEKACDVLNLHCETIRNPGFLNSTDENRQYREGKKRWFMADFYKWQRQRMNILMDGDVPMGGKWSFDDENRKKIPKHHLSEIPEILSIERDTIDEEAMEYVQHRFPNHPGHLDQLYYSTSHQSASHWLSHFLANRLERFGSYEDAIVEGQSWLWHSVLTPSMNIGLLTPDEVVQAAIEFANESKVPINSLEGFLRQVVGWREFMRATYEDLGVPMRTTNHWRQCRAMPKRFYDGTTGIPPVDDTIHRILETGYCHHIERLMVLGGFMFLCEIDPNDIYQWFMELFVDSYDWVMVPNVYAMSQNADGGMITTKPYFSGSSYIRKMSHYKKGPWCDIWDGLYWRWIWKHTDELQKSPRWAMMCSMAKKMDKSKRDQHVRTAETYLENLS